MTPPFHPRPKSKQGRPKPMPRHCVCDRRINDSGNGNCVKCGRPVKK